MEEKYLKLKQIVEKELSCSSHNMDHVMRVYNLCLDLAKNEPGVDLDVMKTAVLLHDIARVKEDQDDSGNTDHSILGAEMAEKILRDFGYPEEKVEFIKHCIVTHRFRSGNEPKTTEAKILFDADKLDVIGSIGIARSFIIAGQYGERIYSAVPVDEYIKDNLIDGKPSGRIKVISKHAPNIEFETKFKHIPDRLYTKKAKEIARQRLDFMKLFFERLKKEINGKM
jgi:uncharacterized protein